MTPALKEFAARHVHADMDDTTLLATEATQLAVAAGIAWEKITAMFSDKKWFKSEDLPCKNYNLALVFGTEELNLLKHIGVADETTATMVLAVAHTTIPEMLEAAKEICKQYTMVDLKMIVFTPNEMKL